MKAERSSAPPLLRPTAAPFTWSVTAVRRLLRAFIVRDFFTEVSYRFSFLVSIVGVFFSAFIFFFLS